MLQRSQLHPYQQYASDFITSHPQAAVLLDCGCGKTVITLTAIADLLWDCFSITKVLVVCPIRVAQVWAEEIQKWEHLQGLRYSIAVGTDSERRYALAQEADVYIINRDVVKWLVEDSGIPWKWDLAAREIALSLLRRSLLTGAEFGQIDQILRQKFSPVFAALLAENA